MGDLILLEILQGIRSQRDYMSTRKHLSALDFVELFGRHMVQPCAENYRALRDKGITIRKTADVIIASFCIDKKLPLLFQDLDFVPFVNRLGLRAVPCA
jgi:predicted nucleic acid-binding protein